jgi:hypothetical protein
MTRVGGIVIVMALIAAWVIFFWPGVLGELHWEESRAPKAGGVVHLPFDPCGRWRPDRLLLWASPCHGCPEEGQNLLSLEEMGFSLSDQDVRPTCQPPADSALSNAGQPSVRPAFAAVFQTAASRS